MKMIEKLGLSALHRLDPERAHDLSIKALELGLVPLNGGPVTSDRLRVSLAGMALANPIGLAAGYDKNGRVINALSRAGFGFIEVGAATPRPQPGNPKPRLFRLTDQQAIINRFGFNNEGADLIGQRLKARNALTPVGLNLGANKDSTDRAEDFATVLKVAGVSADFVTVNVSSPNTEKLRDLQGPDALAALLDRVLVARDGLTKRIPVFVKIAPDLTDHEVTQIAAVARNARLDGVIATNTTLSRDGITGPDAGQAGGLSGKPVFQKSTRVLALLHRELNREIPLIGVGGISSVDDVWKKIQAGASAVQVYSAMIYQGLSIASRLAAELDDRLAREKISLPELTGSAVGDWI